MLGEQADLELGFSAADGHVDMLVAHALQDSLDGGMFHDARRGSLSSSHRRVRVGLILVESAWVLGKIATR